MKEEWREGRRKKGEGKKEGEKEGRRKERATRDLIELPVYSN